MKKLSVQILLFKLLFLFLLVSSLNFLSLWIWIESSEEEGRVINLAGKQRMLTQKMMKESLLISVGVPLEHNLKRTIEEFEANLNGLLSGDEGLGLPRTDSETIRQELVQVENLWRNYKQMMSQLSDSHQALSVSQLNSYHTESIKILKQMNSAVTLFEQANKAKMLSLRNRSGGLFVFSLVLVLGFFLFIRANVIYRLSTTKDKITQLESDLDLRLQLPEGREDEIGKIVRATNKMVLRIKSLCAQFQSGSERIAVSSTQLKGISEQQRGDMESQQQETELVATAIEELLQSVNDIAQNTQLAATVANECFDVAQESAELVSSSVENGRQLALEMQQATDTVSSLGRDSEAIGAILVTIRNIAEQTNLLALNAAIEAARAGEHGRGFAVVADEVRTLALSTQSATEEINNLIERLQNGAQSAQVAIEQGGARSASCQFDINQISDALQVLIGKIDSINGLNTQVASATEQQRMVVGDIGQNVNNVRDMTVRTSDSAMETLALVSDLADMSRDFNKQVAVFKI
ncbi:MAG: methyl-accepting chemotaxis protein [Pseudomonadales bacterium]|nr:methyl-accepting chemotaxis protein [Pseudomonadales bacterium]